ncbi:MAG: MG2 domain-containing protein [Dysgonamonadaceae bacterium]|nr:MG2 domain-containing protein [Dysgonamonadaceae bacterium]
MRNKISITNLLFLVLIAISFASCKEKKSKQIDPEFVQYISGFTYGTISPQSYIQVELAQEMPAVELNAEVKEKLFSFSPSIRGQTVWINTRTLRFIPDANELKMGKEYTAKLHLDKLLKVEGKFRTFDFYFKVSEQNYSFDLLPYSPLSSNDLNWNSVQGTLKLINPATIEDIQNMFVLKGANKEAKMNVTPLSETSYRIVVDSLLRTSKKETYTLRVDGKSIGVKSDEKHSIELPAIPETELEIIDVRISNDGASHIRVTFSSPLALDQDMQGLIVASGVNNYTYRIDKNILYIYPEIFPKDELNLQLNEGIKNNTGLALSKDYTYQLKVDDEKPQIKVEKSGNILPDSEQLTLPFSAVNLWAVDVKVIKIYQNNILYFLQSGSLSGDSQGEIRRFGRLIKKVRIRLDSDKTKDLSNWNQFAIDLAPLIEQDPGAVYMVQLSMQQDYSLYKCGGINPAIPQGTNIRSFSNELITEEDESVWDEAQPYYYEQIDWSEYNWKEKDDPCKPTYYMDRERVIETFVLSSNIGMIAKAGNNNQLSIAVTNILTTDPISGAKVTVYNYQMQEMGSASTDRNGFADIEYQKGRPYVVTAEKGDEKGYLELKEELSLSLSNFDVSGKEIQKGIKGYIYGERGVWRPGDTIHVSFILEDKEQKLPKNHPVILEVYTPKRQFFQRQVETNNENGFYTFTIVTDPSAQTGVWQSYIKVGGTSFYQPLRIESIKPNRLKVRLDTDSVFDASKGAFSGTLNAQWLHGAPASNLKAEVTLSLSKSETPFKNFESYEFNNPLSQFSSNQHKLFEGNLNASGVAGINTKVPMAENAPGMLRGNILSRVYETGGDMSFYAQTIYYSPYNVYAGVKVLGTRKGEFLETDQPLTFDVVSLTPNGKKVSRSNMSYKIYKLSWSWWWNSSEEDLGSYINSTSVSPVAQGSLSTTNGTGKVNFQVDYPDWGRYLILVKDTESGHTSGSVFYVDWPESRGRANRKDPDGLTMLAFSTDKPVYQVGDKSTVTIPKSTMGRALISIENGTRIIQREWIKTSEEEDTNYSFTITEEMNPNVYVFATLLQPHAQTINDLPIRMYGVQNIEVENKDSRLTPVISMPGELRPEKEFTVSISEKAKKPMTYTLAIVDEGLLDLTAFKTPNAWDYFYAREALGVRTWDLFDRVLGANSGMFGPLLSIGGDEALKASSDKVNRFKPIVRFMGPFTLKKGETKTHKLKLPPYVGSVRVMVVAAGNGAYGSAEKTVAVNNPLMTLSTLPRVMGPNEEVWLPINVFAMDNSVRNVQVSIETNGLLKTENGTSQTVQFDKIGDQIVYFKLKADAKTGAEQVRIKATGGGQTVTEVIDIGIRNPNPPIIVSDAQLIDANGSAQLSLTMDEVGANDWAKLELSRLPNINLNKNIDFLLFYPHGCTEQITSQAFPLLYINELTQLDADQKKQMNDKIDQVITILASRQLPDGGFIYWAGNHYASEWATTYAGHFLTEAKSKGFDVSDNLLSRWVQFQTKLANNWSRTVSFQNYYSISMTELQQAYRLYALALNGEPQLGAMNRMRELKDLSVQAKWRLAAAYAITGRKDVANELVFNANDIVEEYNFNNDTYGSPARDEAMIMETYLLLDKTDKALELAQSVAKELSSDYISTQTAAYGLIAMSQLAEKMGKTNIEVNWKLNGKTMSAISTPQPLHQLDITPNENIEISIENKGKGKIYAQLTGRTQPINDTDVSTPQDASFNMSVNYVDLNGKPLSVASLKQGVEFTAIVTVKNSPVQAFTDLALVQIFPSGWEIYNDRILDAGDTNTTSNYNFRDIRDDRVLTYFNLAADQTKTFRVRLQAAYRGTYYLPAVSCQAMYEPREQARTTGSWVRVVESER